MAKKKNLNKLNPFYLPREIETIRRLAAGAFGKIKKLAIDMIDYSDRQDSRLLRVAEIAVMERRHSWESNNDMSFWVYRCKLCNADSRNHLTINHSETCPVQMMREEVKNVK